MKRKSSDNIMAINHYPDNCEQGKSYDNKIWSVLGISFRSVFFIWYAHFSFIESVDFIELNILIVSSIDEIWYRLLILEFKVKCFSNAFQLSAPQNIGLLM
jgi:hypothetical protein